MSEPLELTVLIPTLDEGSHLGAVLAGVRAAAGELTDAFEMLIVDGGSRDGTVAVAEGAGARVVRQRGRGFGAAIREGLELARGRWVLAMDADGSHPVRYFRELWMLRDRGDLIIASRFVPGGGARMTWLRYALSWILNAGTRLFLVLPVRDSSSGFRLYRKGALAGAPLKAEDFSIQQEALVHLLARGGRAEEVPFFYEPRLGGRSKARIIALGASYLRMLATLGRLRGGLGAPAALAAALALGLVTGLWGIQWGLPGPQRLRAFPAAMRPSPEVAQKLADGWRRLYQGIEETHRELQSEEPVTYVQGVEEIPPGWTWPPEKLANSYRSLLLRSENPDEQKSFVSLSRMRPWRLEFKPLYLHYGGGFIYPLGAFLQTAAFIRVARVVPDLRHYLVHPEDMGRLYLLGRLFVLIFQVASLWVIFDLGRRLSGSLTGFCAAALFCLCPFAVAQTHLVKPHPYCAFWALAAMRYLFLAYESGRRREYLLGGLCFGLAAGANSSFACLAGFPLLVWLLRRWGASADRRELREAFMSMAVTAAVYAATNPYIFLATRDFLWETTVYAGHVGDWQSRLSQLPRLLGPWAAAGLGPLLYALSVPALALALLRPEPRRRTLALMFVVGFGVLWVFLSRFWGWMDAGALRFFYPFGGLTCLLAADLVCAWRAPRWIKVLVLAAVFADSGLRAWVYLENYRLDAGPRSTRAQAAAWIDENVAPGAKMGLLRYPQPAHVPPFRYDRYHLVVFERPEFLMPRQRPDYLVVDAEGRGSLALLTQADYELAKAFPSYGLAWARVGEGTFANTSIFIFRRRL